MLLQVRNDLELGTMCVSSPRFSCAAAVFFFLSPSFHLTLCPPFIRPFFPSYLLFLLSTHKQPVPDVCRGYWFLRGARQCRIHASGRPDFYSCCVFSLSLILSLFLLFNVSDHLLFPSLFIFVREHGHAHKRKTYTTYASHE